MKTKHPQSEMLRAIADDAYLADRIEVLKKTKDEYKDCYASELLDYPDENYRFKPREFKDGFWYPVIDRDGSKSFRLFKDGRFYLTDDASFGCFESDLAYIGQAFLPDFGEVK